MAKGNAAPTTMVVKPKTKKGKRALEQRAPKLVEDPKRALILYGNRTSQTVKDVLTDLHKLKGTDSLKFTRRNEDVQPFEAGGEAPLEGHASRANCSLYALGGHSKKRPHNLTLGRLYDFRCYDMAEFGIAAYKSIQSFGGAANTQLGNKPCFVFVGAGFETDPALRQVRSLLLDFFRGRVVESINLKGLDRLLFVSHGEGGKTVLLRQYRTAYRKSGTKVPRVELEEMGPSLDLELRRWRAAPVEAEAEATKVPKSTKKKIKNMGSDEVEGKIGRIYMPKQDVDSIALHKMKGLKRERRAAAEDAAAEPSKRRQTRAASDSEGEG